MARVIVKTTYVFEGKATTSDVMVSTYESVGEAFQKYYDPFWVVPSAWYEMHDYWWLDMDAIHGTRDAELGEGSG